jgi:O-antigen ligase
LEESEQRPLSQPVLRAAAAWPESAVVRLSRPNALTDRLVPLAATTFLFVAVLVVAAFNQHRLTGIHAGMTVQAVRALVPLTAASVAVLCAYRPWPALLAVLALTPIWNTSEMAWQVGPVQVIFQSIFVGVLIVGCMLQARARVRIHSSPAPGRAERLVASGRAVDLRALTKRYSAYRFVEVGALAIVGLAIASTLVSLDPINSATVLLHGIIEPVATGAILIWLRPSRRDLILVAAALGVSIALGSALNFVQSLSEFRSITALAEHRLAFAWATYFNVGLFGVIVAMVVPLVVGLLAARRALRLSPPLVAFLGVVLALTLAGLFFSLSKSAWLATAAGTALLLLMLVKTWRRRMAMFAALAAASAVFIPWPAFVLQVAPPINSAYRTVMTGIVGEARFDSWNPATLAGHGSMAERYYAVVGGVRMALDYPLLGVGLDEFGTYYWDRGYKPVPAQDKLDHAHSLFPEVAAELGIPAVSILVVVFAAAVWAMWRTYRAARDELTRILAATFMAAIAAWVIAATAFGCDIYRAVRAQGSDVMAIAVLLAMAVALTRWTQTHGAGNDRPALS